MISILEEFGLQGSLTNDRETPLLQMAKESLSPLVPQQTRRPGFLMDMSTTQKAVLLGIGAVLLFGLLK